MCTALFIALSRHLGVKEGPRTTAINQATLSLAIAAQNNTLSTNNRNALVAPPDACKNLRLDVQRTKIIKNAWREKRIINEQFSTLKVTNDGDKNQSDCVVNS